MFKLKSYNFNNLEKIDKNLYGFNGNNINPNLYWENPPKDIVGYYIEMENTTTHQIYWRLFVSSTYNEVESGQLFDTIKNDFDDSAYRGPDDINNIVVYLIQIYALNKVYDDMDQMLNDSNVKDSAKIKFIYNGYF